MVMNYFIEGKAENLIVDNELLTTDMTSMGIPSLFRGHFTCERFSVYSLRYPKQYF
jgi:hypothetical protein